MNVDIKEENTSDNNLENSNLNENIDVSLDSQKKLETDEIISELDNSIDSGETVDNNTDKEEIKDSFEITTGEAETGEDYENPDIIIDYRTRFFEEQEKNKKLQEEIEKLNKKLSNIQEIINRSGVKYNNV